MPTRSPILALAPPSAPGSSPARAPQLQRDRIALAALPAELLRVRRPDRVLDHAPAAQLPGALQSIAALLWMALVYLLKGVVLLLEWAFSIDLLGASMSEARRALATLHEQVLGEPWFLAALSVAALWGIWRGLVQGQATRTISGLAATVGLMVCGLVVLAKPDATVGHASRLANDAALGTLSAATTRQVATGRRSPLSDAMIGVFDTLVRQPWCALEFGSVRYCDEHPPGRRDLTNADVWLRYPTGSDERKSLYDLLTGKDPDDHSTLHDLTHPVLNTVGIVGDDRKPLPASVKALVTKDKPRAAMQEAGATVPRFALLAVIGVGMLGAIALLGYLGLRLLLASVMALLLLLFAPAVLLAPAFGETGRATFVAWAKRLAGALVAKLIYALFLAVVLVAAAALARVTGRLVRHLAAAVAFWWGVLLKRNELVGLVPASSVFGDARAGRTRAVARVLRDGARQQHAPHCAPCDRRARGAGHARSARGGRIVTTRAPAPSSRSPTASSTRRHARRSRVTTRPPSREPASTASYTARAARGRPPLDRVRRSSMRSRGRRTCPRRQRRAISARCSPGVPSCRPNSPRPATRTDELRAQHGQRNAARTGDPIDPRDISAYRQRRAQELRAELPPDHERHLRAAGIDPERYATAAEDERERFRRQAEEHLVRERDLSGATDASSQSDRPARRHVDRAELRERTAAEHARRRRERRQRRARTVPPPR